MAPLRRVRLRVGHDQRRRRPSARVPSPSQVGQAPNGLLNENSRGSISGMVKPETGQANFAEKMMRSAPRRSPAGASANSTIGDAVGQLQRGLEAVGEPARHVGAHHEAVDHHLDVVLELLVERRRVGDLVELAVDLHALEAALHEIGEFLAIFALAAAHDRREQIEAACARAAPARGRPSG